MTLKFLSQIEKTTYLKDITMGRWTETSSPHSRQKEQWVMRADRMQVKAKNNHFLYSLLLVYSVGSETPQLHICIDCPIYN